MDNSSLRFECIRCGNCCTDKNTIVNLSYSDIIRLKNGLKLDLNELLEITGFYISKDLSSSKIIHQMVIPPILTEKGKAFIALRKKEDGQCLFFNQETNNCRVYSIRPCFCRTFPFSFEENSKKDLKILITEKGKQYCLGLKKDSPQISLNYWIPLGLKALNVLKKNSKFIKEWNEKVENPTAKAFLSKIISKSQKDKKQPKKHS